MDPAESLFYGDDILLDRKHAHFMEVMHVSSSPMTMTPFIGDLGLFRAVGHVDFYPNGGKVLQPGCNGT